MHDPIPAPGAPRVTRAAAILAAVAWALFAVANIVSQVVSETSPLAPVGWALAAACLGLVLDVVGFILAILGIVESGRTGHGRPLSIVALVAHLLGALGNGLVGAALLIVFAFGAAAEHAVLH